MFRVGVLYRVQELLDLCERREITAVHFHEGFEFFRGINGRAILEMALGYGWVAADAQERYVLTNAGNQIHAQTSSKLRLRLQLKDMLRKTPPPWGPLLKRGRKAVAHYGDGDVVQCFSDAGLLDGADPGIVEWWDDVSTPYWHMDEVDRVRTGRVGERLSMEFESHRVGQPPHWVAVDDVSVGYDLLSVVSLEDSHRLLVEVKSSELAWDRAEFFLSRNEWDTLSSHPHAVVHLWSLAGSVPELKVVDIAVLAGVVPADNGVGRWANAAIPFVAFGEDTTLWPSSVYSQRGQTRTKTPIA